MSSLVDYSKWDRVTYSSSSSSSDEEEDFSRALENKPEYLSISSPLWKGLVTHHRDIFVSHVLPKLTEIDRYCFSKANFESYKVLEYAGINIKEMTFSLRECSTISLLEWAWDNIRLDRNGCEMDQAKFCSQVASTNKLEFLKWAREEKKCK